MAQSVLTASQKLAINFAFERLFRLSGLGENSVGFDVGSQIDAFEGGVVDHLLGNTADGGTATYVDNSITFTTGKLFSIRNNTTEIAYIDYLGSLIGVNASSKVDMQSSITSRGGTSAFIGDSLKTLTATSLTLKGSMVDGATAVGNILDTPTYANATAKIASFRNGTIESSYIRQDGSLIGVNVNSKVDVQQSLTARGSPVAFVGDSLQTLNTASLTLFGQPTDGASAIGFILKSTALANASAKLVSIKNNTTETAYVDLNGGIVSKQLTGANAFTIGVDGGRFKYGSNATAYADSADGITLTFHNNVIGSGAFQCNQYNSRDANTIVMFSSVNDGASAVAVAFDTYPNTLTNATAKIASFRNFSTEKLAVDLNGKLIPTYGDVTGANAGAGGAATSNTVLGRGAIASGASSCVITNSLVTTTCIVDLQLESTGVGIDSLSVSVGNGSFTVTSLSGLGVTTVTGAKTRFSWVVTGA